ncbi:MAG: PAS domain-containing protein [Hyphomicrobium sp.]
MKHFISQKLFSYWNNLRGARFAPRRLEIDPGCIGSILPETFILERIRNDFYSFRLAGSHVCHLLGKELRGQNFLSGWNNKDYKTLLSQLNAISVQGGAALFTLEFECVRGEALLAEMLLLPLLNAEVFADRCIGSLSLFERPVWLQHQAFVNRKLTSEQIISIPYPIKQNRQIPVNEDITQSPIRRSRLIIKKNITFRVFDGDRLQSPSPPRLNTH